ncbi:MAG: caa(3)-type oxidase subunit IV [Caldilinea sp. CFX5]|nr:caa(3)-type oxidase subunit IV [Caldilinea sp. CFX5]
MKESMIAHRSYYLVYGALLALLIASYGAAYLDLGVLHTPVALGIAAAKALLIVLFFMHVRGSRPLTWLFAAAGFVWLAVMLLLVMSDYLSRKM